MKEVVIDVFRNLCDLPVVIGFLDEKIVGVGLNGFFGTITSCIGVYQNWK